MNTTLFKQLALGFAQGLAKSLKTPKLRPLGGSSKGGRFLAAFSFVPFQGSAVPSASLIQSALASAPLPSELQIDNLEVQVSSVKSFHFTARKVLAASLYLVGDDGEVNVAEVTILPFCGTLTLEVFSQ